MSAVPIATKHAALVVPLDRKIGGYAQDWTIPAVNAAVGALVLAAHCRILAISIDCGPFSALRCLPGDKPLLFSCTEPDGVTSLAGQHKRDMEAAKAAVASVIDIARPAVAAGKALWWEGPVGRGKDAGIWAIAGQEDHSPMWNLTIMRQFIADLQLSFVYADQGSAGGVSAKATAFLVTADLLASFNAEIGSLPLFDGQRHLARWQARRRHVS